MSEMKNDPSELYDEEFLKKKEEPYNGPENNESESRYTIDEDNDGFEQLVDGFDDGDLTSDSGSEKGKKVKKNKKDKKKKDEVIDTPEPEYDIFDLEDRFGIEADNNVKKPKIKKAKKKKLQPKKEVKSPPKPREPHKPFVPHTPVEKIQADVYVKDEELYKEQSVDIDELLRNLGIPTAEEIAKQQEEENIDISSFSEDAPEDDDGDVKVYSEENKEEKTDISSHSDEETEENQETDAESEGGTKHFTLPEKNGEEKPADATRHFNITEYAKTRIKTNEEENRKKRANFTQHFRFLKNKESDEPILEAAPTGKGKDSVMDSVKADEGEDIFTAVEKAQKKKKRKKLNTKQTFISLKDYEDKLTARLSKGKTNLCFAGIALVLAFVLTVIPSFYVQGGALEFLFGNSAVFYGITNILVFALTALVARKELLLGFNNIRYLSPDQNSVTVILGIFVLIYNIVTLAMGTAGMGGAVPYTLCFAFAVLVRFTGAYIDDLTALRGVRALSEKGDYEGVHYVASKNDALAIAHGLSEKTVPTILYGSESRVDEGIREDRAPKKDEEKIYGFTSVAVLIAGFVTGVILYIRNKDAVSFVTALTACVCFCLPIMNEFVSSVFFFDVNSRLSKKGAAVNDIEALEILSQAKAVSADVRDLFVCEISAFRKVKGAPISKTDAAVFAASALKHGGSMVGACFEELIKSLEISLPEAEDLQYEEKLGFSCWIAERRVLVGRRQMLVEHSIAVPTEAEEKAYAGKKNVMYVVVDGQIVASFLIAYKVVPSFRKLAPRFDKTGLVLMINSFEPCLDEVNCAARLSLDVASVKLLSHKAANLMDSYKDDSEKGRATSLICRREKGSLLSLIVKAHELYQGDRLITNLLLSGQAVALVLVFLSVILNMPLFFSPFTILILQAVWSFVAFTVASADFRNIIKKKIGLLIAKGRKSK